MTLWWKTVLAVALLSLHESFAKNSYSSSVSRGAHTAKATNSRITTRVEDARGRTLRDDYDGEKYNKEEEEEDSLDPWSDNGDDLPDAWDSQEDSDGSEGTSDQAQDWRLARDDRRHLATPRRQRPSRPFPSADVRYVRADEEEDDDDDALDAYFSEDPTMWGSDGEEEDVEDDFDEYEDVRGVPPRRDGPQASKQGSMRPSAWTGNAIPANARLQSSARRVPSRRGPSRGSVARYNRGRRAAASRGFSVSMPTVSGVTIASALRRQMELAREAVEQAGSLAASTSKRLKREVKLVVSGSWESALLKVTWPDDLPPDDALVDSLVEAVKVFKLDRDVTRNSAEHRVLLRKLWAKMSEPDWRTVSKALYLFHTILQEISSGQHAVLKIFLGKMSRESDKRTGGCYFDLDVLCGVSGEGETFRSFLGRYGSYVFRRARDFDARFQELDSMRSGEGCWENVVTVLVKAQKAIDLGISCCPEPEEETELTVLCLRNTAYDLRQLWRRFHSALVWVLEEAENGDLFEGADTDVVGECLEEFKEFYSTRYKRVVAFLVDTEELLDIYGVDIPELGLPLAHDFVSMASATVDDDDTECDEGDDDGQAGRRDSTSRRPAADTNLGVAEERSVAVNRASKPSLTGGRDTRSFDRSEGLGEDLSASGAAGTGAEVVSPIADGGVGGGSDRSGNDGIMSCEKGTAAPAPVATKGGVGERESGAEDLIRSIPGAVTEPAAEDSEESEDEEDEDEDSAEEGAVDEHVDDLTFFDDATQPDGTDPDWDKY